MYLARRNPFLRATALGDLEAVRRMLDAGENIDQTDQDGSSAVHIALVNRNLPMLKLLARRGANLMKPAKKTSGSVFYPVETAILSGFVDGLRFMVDEKDVPLYSAQMDHEDMLLFHALEGRNNILTLRYLIEEKQLDPRRAIFEGNFTLLHQAELANVHPAIVEYLLRKGVDPNINCRNMTRNTKDPRTLYDGLPLVMAAFKGEPERVVPYLRHFADPFLKNRSGKNAFDAADEKWRPRYDETVRDFEETSRLLDLASIRRNLPASAQNAFVLACAMGDLAEVDRRLKAGENPDQMDSQGMAGIHIAMESHDLELLLLLMEHHANPRLNIGNDENRLTPVELGIEKGFLLGLHFLVDNEGVELEARPGHTVDDLLFHALERNDNILTLRWLVERKGLDPSKAGLHEKIDILEESELANSFLTYTEYFMLAGMDPDHETPEQDRRMSDIDLYDTAGAVEESYSSLPLVRAAFNAEAALVDLYLDYRADPLKWNRHNNTAWDAVTDKLNPRVDKDPEDCEIIQKKLIRAAGRAAESGSPPALPPGPS